MHYRNGREAKNGDKVVQLSMSDDGKVVAFGVLYDAVPGSDYCNGKIAQVGDTGACLIDCLHVEDLAALLAEKGLDKRPAAIPAYPLASPEGDAPAPLPPEVPAVPVAEQPPTEAQAEPAPANPSEPPNSSEK